MATAGSRRSRRSTDIWPGFVDALATLLMVIIFLLLIFVLAQFVLGQALSGRNEALQRARTQIDELGQLLSLERKANADMRINVAQMSEELQASVRIRESLSDQIRAMTARVETAESESERFAKDLEEAFKSIQADREKVELKMSEVAALEGRVEALRALKEELEKKLSDSGAALAGEKKISDEARAEVALLNQQLSTLREQIARLNAALEASELKSKEQDTQIANLGSRLNAALASKVHELARYRSEFFGRLREILGDQKDISIVGDRFVFQSEVLFEQGSAELGEQGKDQMARLGKTLIDLTTRIPADIDWVLRVDGHTDRVPIMNWRFPSNWELSTARAISVVRFLVGQGVPAQRLAATGFADQHPLIPGKEEEALRRNRRIELKLTER